MDETIPWKGRDYQTWIKKPNKILTTFLEKRRYVKFKDTIAWKQKNEKLAQATAMKAGVAPLLPDKWI